MPPSVELEADDWWSRITRRPWRRGSRPADADADCWSRSRATRSWSRVGKKRTLDDVDESTFEPAVEAKLENELIEDQGFTLSEADDADEPEQQVMAAGATADPVKDYLKQIGKVALLNAEQEVELAKRIEAGLFADEKLNDDGAKVRRPRSTTSTGSPRTAAGPRTTCWRPTCGWWSRWPSGTPVAACCSWT